MRGVNLIAIADVELNHWYPALRGKYPSAILEHCPITARNEGQPDGVMNRLTLEADDDRLELLDRPTTVREYGKEDYEALVQRIGVPKKYFAVSFSSEALLRGVLTAIEEVAGTAPLFVETEEDGTVYDLTSFLAK